MAMAFVCVLALFNDTWITAAWACPDRGVEVSIVRLCMSLPRAHRFIDWLTWPCLVGADNWFLTSFPEPLRKHSPYRMYLHPVITADMREHLTCLRHRSRVSCAFLIGWVSVWLGGVFNCSGIGIGLNGYSSNDCFLYLWGAMVILPRVLWMLCGDMINKFPKWSVSI